jgi:hypothetical protein
LVVQPGDPATCSFPVAFDLHVNGTFIVLFDSSGQPVQLLLDEHWTGTGTANGKQVIEHAAQTDLIDLVSGDSTNVGQIRDQALSRGVVIHDVGLLRLDPNGNVTFEAGPHQGLNGDVAGLCAALAP